jgi:hypothetical protein
VREVAPLAFSDSQSNVGTFVLLAMVALAAALLLFGFGVTPARAARWPAAARVLEEQGDLLVTRLRDSRRQRGHPVVLPDRPGLA